MLVKVVGDEVKVGGKVGMDVGVAQWSWSRSSATSINWWEHSCDQDKRSSKIDGVSKVQANEVLFGTARSRRGLSEFPPSG